MNYRHVFHAGNFADVLKHAVLALVLEHLKLKPRPFAVVDTHAGSGLYRLDGPMAARTGEWQQGIGRLLGDDAEPLPEEVAPLLGAYLGAVRRLNPSGGLAVYPGSPLLALMLMRDGDRLVANELHPEEHAALRAAIGHDARVRLLEIDGWQALKANLPPKERRGVVLIDPPFEVAGEMERLGSALAEGVRRFATGTYLLWLPLKDARQVAILEGVVARQEHDKVLWAELSPGSMQGPERLGGSALIIVNPPYTLAGQLEVLLPFLAERLDGGSDARSAGQRWALRQPGLARPR